MSSNNTSPNLQAATPVRVISGTPVQQVHIVRVTPVRSVLEATPSVSSVKRFNNGENKAVITNDLQKLNQIPLHSLPIGTSIQVRVCQRCDKIWHGGKECPICKQESQTTKVFTTTATKVINCLPPTQPTTTTNVTQATHSKPVNSKTKPLTKPNILSSSTQKNSITKRTFYGTRIIQQPLQQQQRVIQRPLPQQIRVNQQPLQQQQQKTTSALIRTLPSSSSVTIQAITAPKPVIRRAPRAKPEPVCLTLSSDDDEGDDETAGEASNTASQEQAENSISAKVLQQDPLPVSDSSPRLTVPRVLPCVTEESLINLNCRSIRIGSYKIHNIADPESLPVHISRNAVMFTVPTTTDPNAQVQIIIRLEDIASLLVCFDKRLFILFIFTNPGFAGAVRTRLRMTQADSCYYDPAATDETHKKITIIPMDLTERHRLFIRQVFKVTNKLKEISQVKANEILMRSTPLADRSLVITITPVTTRSATVQQRQELVANVKPESDPTKPVVKSNTVGSSLCKRLMTFPPPPQTGGIAVTSEDIFCLDEGEYVNDVIIDFYLKYLWTVKLSEADRNRTHIFSSYFFPRLSSRLIRNKEEEKLTAQEIRHARVKTWTRSVDIFEKDFLIVPVNQQSHWFLIIICFPGLVSEKIRQQNLKEYQKFKNLPANSTTSEQDANKSSEESETQEPDMSEENSNDVSTDQPLPSNESVPKLDAETTMESQNSFVSDVPQETDQEKDQDPSPAESNEQIPLATPRPPIRNSPEDSPKPVAESSGEIVKEPCILVFDSLPGASRWRVVSYLREYLESECKFRKGKTLSFDRHAMKGVNARVPKQTNFHDCGVYVLQYVESFFEKPIMSYKSPLGNMEDWFSEEVGNEKRIQLKELIYELQKQQISTKPPK